MVRLRLRSQPYFPCRSNHTSTSSSHIPHPSSRIPMPLPSTPFIALLTLLAAIICTFNGISYVDAIYVNGDGYSTLAPLSATTLSVQGWDVGSTLSGMQSALVHIQSQINDQAAIIQSQSHQASDIASLTLQVQSHNSTLWSQASQLIQLTAQLNQMKIENYALRYDIDTLKRQNADLIANVTKTALVDEAQQAVLDSLSIDVSDMRTQMSGVNTLALETLDSIQRTEASVAVQAATLAVMTSVNSTNVAGMVGALQVRVDMQATQLTQLDAANSGQAEIINYHDTKITSLQSDLASAQSTISEYTSQIQALQSTSSSHTQAITTLQSNVVSTQQFASLTNTTLTSVISDLSSIVSALSSRVTASAADVSDKLSSVSSDALTQTAVTNALAARVSVTEVSIKALNASLSTQATSLASVQTATGALSARVNTTESNDAQLNSRVTSLESGLSSLQSRVSALNNSISNVAAPPLDLSSLSSRVHFLEVANTSVQLSVSALGSRVTTLESSASGSTSSGVTSVGAGIVGEKFLGPTPNVQVAYGTTINQVVGNFTAPISGNCTVDYSWDGQTVVASFSGSVAPALFETVTGVSVSYILRSTTSLQELYGGAGGNLMRRSGFAVYSLVGGRSYSFQVSHYNSNNGGPQPFGNVIARVRMVADFGSVLTSGSTFGTGDGGSSASSAAVNALSSRVSQLEVASAAINSTLLATSLGLTQLRVANLSVQAAAVILAARVSATEALANVLSGTIAAQQNATIALTALTARVASLESNPASSFGEQFLGTSSIITVGSGATAAVTVGSFVAPTTGTIAIDYLWEGQANGVNDVFIATITPLLTDLVSGNSITYVLCSTSSFDERYSVTSGGTSSIRHNSFVTFPVQAGRSYRFDVNHFNQNNAGNQQFGHIIARVRMVTDLGVKSDLTTRVQNLEAANSTVQSSYATLAARVGIVESASTSMSSSLYVQGSLISALQLTDVNEQTTIASLQSTVGVHSSQLSSLNSTLQSQSLSLMQLALANLSVQQAATVLTTRVSAAESYSSQLSGMVTAQLSQIVLLQASNISVQANVASLSTRMGSAESYSGFLTTSLGTHSTQITALQSANTSVQTAVAALSSRLSNVESTGSSLTSVIGLHSSQIAVLNSTLISQSAQISLLQAANVSVQGTVAALSVRQNISTTATSASLNSLSSRVTSLETSSSSSSSSSFGSSYASGTNVSITLGALGGGDFGVVASDWQNTLRNSWWNPAIVPKIVIPPGGNGSYVLMIQGRVFNSDLTDPWWFVGAELTRGSVLTRICASLSGYPPDVPTPGVGISRNDNSRSCSMVLQLFEGDILRLTYLVHSTVQTTPFAGSTYGIGAGSNGYQSKYRADISGIWVFPLFATVTLPAGPSVVDYSSRIANLESQTSALLNAKVNISLGILGGPDSSIVASDYQESTRNAFFVPRTSPSFTVPTGGPYYVSGQGRVTTLAPLDSGWIFAIRLIRGSSTFGLCQSISDAPAGQGSSTKGDNSRNCVWSGNLQAGDLVQIAYLVQSAGGSGNFYVGGSGARGDQFVYGIPLFSTTGNLIPSPGSAIISSTGVDQSSALSSLTSRMSFAESMIAALNHTGEWQTSESTTSPGSTTRNSLVSNPSLAPLTVQRSGVYLIVAQARLAYLDPVDLWWKASIYKNGASGVLLTSALGGNTPNVTDTTGALKLSNGDRSVCLSWTGHLNASDSISLQYFVSGSGASTYTLMTNVNGVNKIDMLLLHPDSANIAAPSGGYYSDPSSLIDVTVLQASVASLTTRVQLLEASNTSVQAAATALTSRVSSTEFLISALNHTGEWQSSESSTSPSTSTRNVLVSNPSLTPLTVQRAGVYLIVAQARLGYLDPAVDLWWKASIYKNGASGVLLTSALGGNTPNVTDTTGALKLSNGDHSVCLSWTGHLNASDTISLLYLLSGQGVSLYSFISNANGVNKVEMLLLHPDSANIAIAGTSGGP